MASRSGSLTKQHLYKFSTQMGRCIEYIKKERWWALKKREMIQTCVLSAVSCVSTLSVCVCVWACTQMFVSRVLSDTLLPLLCPVWSGGQAGAWRCAKRVQGRAVQFCQPPGAAAGSAADHHAPVWEVSRVFRATVISLGGILILACFRSPSPT